MSGFGLVPPLQSLDVGIANVAVLVVLLTGGLVGMSIRNMFDSILSEDGDAAKVDADGDTGAGGDEGMADGGLMAEDGDDFGDLGGLDDGGDGGFDDDGFGEMEDAGAGTDELEHRLDELENEVGSLSSTVNTVRTENEQISESVEDVQENVRKLLDIYEMVTRGVNPFADDIEAGMGGMADGGSFGLFDGDDGGGEEEALDDDIAAADAEGFFDEELVDDAADEFDGVDAAAEEFDVDDATADDGEFDDAFDDFEDGGDFDDEDGEFFDEEGGEDAGAEEGGKSFQELKDEYDSGDADWAGGEAPTESDEEPTQANDEPSAEDGDDLADDELFDQVIEADEATDEQPPEADGTETGAATEAVDTGTVESDATADSGTAEETASEDAAGSGAGTADDSAGTAGSGTVEESTAGAGPSDRSGDANRPGKPYLAELPDGFAGDLVVVEWLEFLTERSSYRATDEAIGYYERIEWISPTVAATLREYLRGFETVEGSDGALTIEDHTQSLQYISQLDGDGSATVALSKLVGGGGGNGLQR